MSKKWTEEQKQAASQRMKERHASKRQVETLQRTRIPIGTNRDVTAVRDTPDGYKDRWVNDNPGRIEKFKQAGYELVASAQVGDSAVDGTHSEGGVVSRDMGNGVTAYLMRQRREYFDEDQAAKQRLVNQTEENLRRKKRNSTDPDESGQYGEVKIN